MARIIKNICLETDVAEDVSEKIKKYKWNFSEWVNSEYRKQFMSVEGYQSEIDKNNKRNEELIAVIKIIKDRNETIRKNITDNEKRTLSKVPDQVRKGFEWNAIRNRFNNDFNRDFNLSEFQELVRSIDRDKARQLSDRLKFVGKNKGKK